MQSQISSGRTRYIYQEKKNYGANKLIVLTEGFFREFNLTDIGKDRIIFGRDELKCDIVIPSEIVSGVHGKIKIENNAVYLADLNSTNGLYALKRKAYRKLKPGFYTKKESGDWIIRIDSPTNTSVHAVVMVFTNSSRKNPWKCMDIPQGYTRIGRDPSNNIVMEGECFSRHHAVIMRQGNDVYITDLGSMNGIYVNGIRITKSVPIKDKDIIQIAGSLFLMTGCTLMYQEAMSGVNLTLSDISKTVGKPGKKKKILQHVFCDIESNDFVAVIGGSGAGKTTMMTAMSGFDRDIYGYVYMNGIDLHQNFDSLKNMIGFVPQQDIIYENLKLWKMLEYTAKLKMPSDVSKGERDNRIKRVLEMVGLVEKADTYIRKLSGGQKKRASIAVELLANPGLFFLDEPTSGLDPDTEKSLMHTLADLSKNEDKTIIMVTHTTASLHLCDKVIFMAPGGKICYCGSPDGLLEYFGKEDLTEIYSELAINADYWNSKYLVEYFNKKNNTDKSVMQEKKPVKGTKQVNSIYQLFVLIARYTKLICNDFQRLLLLFVQPIAIAAMLSFVAESGVFKTYSPTQSMMFALSCSGIWIGLFNTIQEICKERPILKREYMSNLKLWTYILSKFVVQGVICFIQTTLVVILFLLIKGDGLKDTKHILFQPAVEIWITVFLTICASSAMGLIVSSLVRNADRAMAVAPFLLIIQLLFAGVIFPLSGISKILSGLTVSRWAMEGLGSTAWLNHLKGIANDKVAEKYADMVNQSLEGSGVSVTPENLGAGKKVMESMYVHSSLHLIKIWLILATITFICGIVSIYVLRSLKKDTR